MKSLGAVSSNLCVAVDSVVLSKASGILVLRVVAFFPQMRVVLVDFAGSMVPLFLRTH